MRPAAPGDRGFLEQRLAITADWREPTPRPVPEVLVVPELAHYITGWPAAGDFGVIAMEDAPVGAARWRHFSARHPGYGFVDQETPEISIAIQPEARAAGRG